MRPTGALIDACRALRARGGGGASARRTARAGRCRKPDDLYDRAGGWRARWALRQQLIAVEALADDL
jgi:hypothetical protein